MALSFGRDAENRWVVPMCKGDSHNGACSLGMSWGQGIGESLARQRGEYEACIILAHIHLYGLLS